MAFCQNCGTQLPEGSAFCSNCGAPVASAAQPVQPEQPVQPVLTVEPTLEQVPAQIPVQPPVAPVPEQAPVQQPVPPVYEQPPMMQMPPVQPMPPAQPVFVVTDHTAEFEAEDISENKVIAMAAYLLGVVGIIIALLAAPNSAYAAFHSRQALKLEIVSMLLVLVTAVLFWTFIIPILSGLCMMILAVVRIICFVHVCMGKAKDAPLISALPFLK